MWKQKCKELFDICKDLQNENDDLKQAKTIINKVDGGSSRGGVINTVDTHILEDG